MAMAMAMAEASSTQSLEEELNVPTTAILDLSSVTTSLRASLCLPSSSDGSKTSIPIDLSSSLRWKNPSNKSRAKPRCLIVGRQAATADIRIDHKSISRKHATLFFQLDSTYNEPKYHLCLLPTASKHGTFVNSQRILDGASHILHDRDTIQFGNCTQYQFQIVITSQAPGQDASMEAMEMNGTQTQPTSVPQSDDSGEPETEEQVNLFEGLTGRARREAEIAAMMASLDDAPAYNKYQAEVSELNTLSEEHNAAVDADTITQPQQSKNQQQHPLPVTHEVEFAHVHTKSITAMAMDPAGSRLITGSNDYTCQMYDFGGMNASHKPFQEIVVNSTKDYMDAGQFPISSISYSPSGDKFVIATTGACPKVYDRDGHEIIQFIKGDMYVTDMARTKGHVNSVTAVQWHPLERDIILTASLDGSVRSWDIMGGRLSFDNKLICQSVYRAKNSSGQRTQVTSVCYHPDGREFALGTVCGSIQIWNATAVRSRPERLVYDAHGTNIPITSLTYSPNGLMLASRAGESGERDDTVRVWGTKKLRQGCSPLMVCKSVSSFHEHSNCAFSPDGKKLCIGATTTAGEDVEKRTKPQGDGLVKFFSIPEGKVDDFGTDSGVVLEPILQLRIAPNASIVNVLWHPKLNQILCGASDGSVRVLYDPQLSKKGVLLSSSRSARTKNELELLLAERKEPMVGTILTPNALPMFRDPEKETKRKRELERMDPVKKRRPEAPSTSKHLAGGRSSVSVNFTQFVVQATVKNKNIAGKDPREELFKYTEGKNYVDQAYAGDVKVFANKTAEEEEEEAKKL